MFDVNYTYYVAICSVCRICCVFRSTFMCTENRKAQCQCTVFPFRNRELKLATLLHTKRIHSHICTCMYSNITSRILCGYADDCYVDGAVCGCWLNTTTRQNATWQVNSKPFRHHVGNKRNTVCLEFFCLLHKTH